MKNHLPRLLLAIAGLLLLFGGTIHTLAFRKAVAAIANSNIAPFFGSSLKGLWLIDSTVLFTLAVTFLLLAFRPRMASGGLILLLDVIPTLTAAWLYFFIGSFPPAHLLLTVAVFPGGFDPASHLTIF